MNLVGKVIGNRYEMLEKIGEGGMATVYKARCNILKRYVAVKVLREEFTTDEEFIRRFNTEAQSNNLEMSLSQELDFFFDNVMDTVVDYFKEEVRV